jgi:hypothetical protein
VRRDPDGITLRLRLPGQRPRPFRFLRDLPQAVQVGVVNANTSWNLAIVAFGICFGAFLASVIAAAWGWHPDITGRTAAGSLLAMAACGVWLRLSASRFGPLEPEPDDEEGDVP